MKVFLCLNLPEKCYIFYFSRKVFCEGLKAPLYKRIIFSEICYVCNYIKATNVIWFDFFI